MHASRHDIFRRLLIALWLRPESALWYSHMLHAAQSLGADALPSPTLEFGSMDGLNAFVLLGGEIDFSFDVFGDVEWSYDAHKRSTLANDYYDRVNAKSENLWPRNTRPERRFDYGIDWKTTHIEKAARAGVHDQLILWQPNSPLNMIGDSSIGGIWAPNTYWMDDVDGLFREFARITRRDGKIVTIVPDVKLLDHMLYRFAEPIDKVWAQDLDRGRYENASRSAATLEQWRLRIQSASLRIIEHKGFIPPVVAGIYEIGFRPLFAVLMNMYEKIKSRSPDDLIALKRNWVDTVDFFVTPFVDDTYLAAFGQETLWHIFALQPDK
jgi:hypothetical protein